MDDHQRNLKRGWKAEQKTAARASFPLSDSDLGELFAHVGESVDESGCDHSLRFTSTWLQERGHESAAVLEWLGEHGGFCDCEVAGNAREHWEENRA